MSKYEAFLHHEDDDVNGDCRSDFPYFVGNPDVNGDCLGPKFTVAEAQIIAFALNAVANGHMLRYRTRGGDPITVDYDGPTEGVAP